MCLAGLLFMAGLGSPAAANCIAHQPANAKFTPPSGLSFQWDCVTAGPLYEHERRWYLVTFKFTNVGQLRTEAVKMQANLVDAFGEILLSIPIIENARLGNGDADGAVWAFRSPVDPHSVDHVNFFVLAAKFVDGTLWTSPHASPKIGPTPGPRADLRRFSMAGNYDIGSVINPTPGPRPTRYYHP